LERRNVLITEKKKRKINLIDVDSVRKEKDLLDYNGDPVHNLETDNVAPTKCG